MRIAFDFLKEPIRFSDSEINVLCIENKVLFRRVINAFIENSLQEANIVFSKEFKPIDFKKNACVIYDYFHFDFSSSFIKKIYDDISDFCNNELQDDVALFRTYFESLFDKIINEYDYDFQYNYDLSLQLFFKACELKPANKTNSLLENLTQYILLLKKYVKINYFVLVNLHLYFSSDEIMEFYKTLYYNHIYTLVLENEFNFSKLNNEKITIVDNDLCEII